MQHDNDNAGDLLLGAKAIADFLGINERQARRLFDALPIFKLGGHIAARRSTLSAHFKAAEGRGVAA